MDGKCEQEFWSSEVLKMVNIVTRINEDHNHLTEFTSKTEFARFSIEYGQCVIKMDNKHSCADQTEFVATVRNMIKEPKIRNNEFPKNGVMLQRRR